MGTIRTLVTLVLAGWLLVACGSLPGPGDGSSGTQVEVVPGQYIITLNQEAVSVAAGGPPERVQPRIPDHHRAEPGRPLWLINGFVAVDLDEDDVEMLLTDPRVASVEPDVVVRAQNSQTGAIWNLDRIDQRVLPLDGTYGYGPTGAGVTAYIVDTGILSTHTEFGGRVAPGYTAFDDEYGTEDCNSHGTHVAGTVGGAEYGVAKDVGLVPVRVLNCTGAGSSSGVIAGLDWIAANRSGPTVVNMSLGGGLSPALDAAVQNLVASGVTVVVAAGNSNADACNYSPARVAEALTTGATTSSDARAWYSNTGACVDLFAPGSSVLSAVIDGDTSSGLKSGTSMAAPHVAGVAALLLQGLPSATPGQIMTTVLEASTSGVLADIGPGSPNALLFVDPMATAPDPVDEPPPTDPEPDPEPDPDPDPEPEPTLPTDPEPDPEPKPEPEPEPTPPCTDCDVYRDELLRSGDHRLFPTNATSSYTTRSTSVHLAWLRGPRGADFDLYLERQNRGGRWVTVARAEGSGADEEITYAGKAGTYRWRVVSKEGAGEFDLYLSLP